MKTMQVQFFIIKKCKEKSVHLLKKLQILKNPTNKTFYIIFNFVTHFGFDYLRLIRNTIIFLHYIFGLQF